MLTHDEFCAVKARFAHLGLSDLALSEIVADVALRVIAALPEVDLDEFIDNIGDDHEWSVRPATVPVAA